MVHSRTVLFAAFNASPFVTFLCVYRSVFKDFPDVYIRYSFRQQTRQSKNVSASPTIASVLLSPISVPFSQRAVCFMSGFRTFLEPWSVILPPFICVTGISWSKSLYGVQGFHGILSPDSASVIRHKTAEGQKW